MTLTTIEVAGVVVASVCAVAGAMMTLLLVGVGLWGMFSGFATKKETDAWRVEVRGYFDKINGRIRTLEDWRKAEEFVERRRK